MLDTRTVLACAIAAGVSVAALAILVRWSASLGLVDRPNVRKHHVGEIPLVGGLSVFIGMLAGALWLGGFGHFVHVLLATAATLALLGALDDRYDLSVRARLLVQTIAILAVIATTGVYIHSLGSLFGHELMLGWLGIPFTVVAVIGLLNAFNMMDGIDGLAGSLSLVSIGAILLYGNAAQVHGPAALMLLMGAALLPYLAANLGLVGRKVFLGDAGSMVLGYLFAWTLIDFSQGNPRHLSPVDVLWCVALPVLDTLAVMYRRLRQGKSPFKPDRGHIHHIIMGAGLGPRSTLICLIAFAAALAFFGSVVRLFGTAANLAAFGVLVAVYTVMATRLWVRQVAKQEGIASLQAANDSDITTRVRSNASLGTLLGNSQNALND
ncbi:undecaprenyl/decaprenyl-phosphate alpha-N-acetylglucosaminyl 1-phosphate transferase [Fulvimonas sp. R45]|uniref:undecaprenyl/decaprenyl-phosphate alpha-N-acetylglucosaminyl 1-phosphate transferase n=1 Tax=Fulvimonas sp. R45 TaxID=3045937 RepID=UPI00265F8D85|nr:undecaprenyl/decaprenyl-phosphate alpha-N-acetylglucosaminyl 1-phosphate transferase [Fulvimonas sp. R45]MDO1528154.1 undecaprenyl/decaprenyl-phosphate alpha-N-acetylglucosaminyl 1-phosphate transferase [Fulvimonas sp. R45]